LHTEFHKKIGTKDGLFQWCIDCHRVITKTRYSERLKDKSFAQAESLKVKVWRANNPEKYQIGYKQYAKDNKDLMAAKAAKYRNTKNNRIPKWLSSDDYWIIKEAYKLASLRSKFTGVKWEVDHIIPLHSSVVSGLHVPLNLQVITKKQNQVKSNKFL
jgi:5-methylcytosine-specific restriction endonuclease McrA